ncbi:hypothetical protein [Saccharopolyspora mangrovi]|uniref:Uncharacterized protein n=1 Tax=Saccharopolyspora mangrovi TaxID=3082379 RepID=A0ABU6AJL8_9PSEU|nr:hypothetical protein [Saccharopolyspora sp. S2-29]MEB3371767.1 hypothetical protein [Saccharopolyspora sp. S2-29]
MPAAAKPAAAALSAITVVDQDQPERPSIASSTSLRAPPAIAAIDPDVL